MSLARQGTFCASHVSSTELPTSRKVFFQNVQSTNFSVHIISHYRVLTRHFYEAKINKPTALCYTYAIKSSAPSDTVHIKHSSRERHTPLPLIGFLVINYTLCSVHCFRQSKHRKPLWNCRDWIRYCIESNEFVTCKRQGEEKCFF